MEAKEMINNLYDLGLKQPSAIVAHLESKNVEVPLMGQLYNYLARLRAKLNGGKNTLSLGELASWCEDHALLPDGEKMDDEPFVVAHQFFFDESPNNPDPNYTKGDVFRFYISTPRLITLSGSSTVLHADATYKLTWHNFPVLIIGTSDANRTFHPFGLCVTTRERSSDFEFLFKSVQTGRERLGLPLLPSSVNLMADAADAITNGYASVFQGKRGMCWFHTCFL